MGNSNSSDNSNSSSVQLNPMIQYEQQQKIFDTVAEGFKNEITLVKNKMARNDPPFSRRLENEASYCCNESEKTILLDFAIKIKKVLPNYSFTDICIAVIYTYYGLVLNEVVYYFNIKPVKKDRWGNPIIQQKTLQKRFNFWINQFSDNIENVYTLFMRLGAPNENPPSTNYIYPPGDENFTDDENDPEIFYEKIVNPTTGDNLSEQFRQSVLVMKQKRKRSEGGKPKSKSKTKKPKPKKSKRRPRKP